MHAKRVIQAVLLSALATTSISNVRSKTHPVAREGGSVYELRLQFTYSESAHGSWEDNLFGRVTATHRIDNDLSFSGSIIERAKNKSEDPKMVDLGDPDLADYIQSVAAQGAAQEKTHSATRETGQSLDALEDRSYSGTAVGNEGNIHFFYNLPGNSMQAPEGGGAEAGIHYKGTQNDHFRRVDSSFPAGKDDTTSSARDIMYSIPTPEFGSIKEDGIHRVGTGFQISKSFNKTWTDEHGVSHTKTMNITGTVQLVTDLELVVSSAIYDSWIPAPSDDDEIPGSTQLFTAKLKTRSGRPLTAAQQPKKYTFKLTSVSHEPGICMNYPSVKHEDFAKSYADLQFPKAKNSLAAISGEGNSQAEITSSALQAAATVSAFDGGAFGNLEVQVELRDGTIVIGHLDGQPAVSEILLPKRSSGSKIADAWKEREQSMAVDGAPDLKTLADDDDSEGRPEGDGHPGDGLTMYEEYRGFFENKQFIRTNPFKKDVFVCDKVGGRSKDGIAMFTNLTGLAVHDKFTEGEFGVYDYDVTGDEDYGVAAFPHTKIINTNHVSGPHHVDQHGIVIMPGQKALGMALCIPRRGPPKYVKCVLITPDFNPGPSGWNSVHRGVGSFTTDSDGSPYMNGPSGQHILTDNYASTIAHEMLHAIAVQHHGEKDWWNCSIYQDPANPAQVLLQKVELAGDIYVPVHGTSPIVIKPTLEDGSVLDAGHPLFANGGTIMYVANEEDSQHGGFDDCVMRYDSAQAYAYKAGGVQCVAFTFDHEMAGIQLCTKPDGTGVNDPHRDPRPRYGRAQEGRGDCKHKFCVSDAYDFQP